MVSRLDSKGAEVRKSCKNIWNRLTRLSRDSSIQKQSLFFMEKRCSRAAFFQPGYFFRFFFFLFFFARTCLNDSRKTEKVGPYECED